MAKQKKVVIKGVTENQFNDAMQLYASADAKQNLILAKLDDEIAKIRRKYDDDLADLTKTKDEHFEIIEVYCAENPQLFEKKKSFETLHGVVGFRTGTPKLKLKKGFTWPSVTNMLKEFLPQYIRTTEEPAKDMILSAREEIEPQLLDKVGVMVVQDETFYVDLKKEEVTA